MLRLVFGIIGRVLEFVQFLLFLLLEAELFNQSLPLPMATVGSSPPEAAHENAQKTPTTFLSR
jgi:hypothetical protein